MRICRSGILTASVRDDVTTTTQGRHIYYLLLDIWIMHQSSIKHNRKRKEHESTMDDSRTVSVGK